MRKDIINISLYSKYSAQAAPMCEGDSPCAQPLFTTVGRRALMACAAENVLLAFDYDGTIAPIDDDPVRVALRPRTKALLRVLARRYPVAVLSGRRESDVVHRIEGTGVWIAAGHDAHWLDGSRPPDEIRGEIAAWRLTAVHALRFRRGVQIEPKEFALALHYRRAPDEDEARRAIAAAVRSFKGARLVFGNRVVNVIPPGTLSKAAVLARIRRDFACDAVLYVGDDEEDEEVFRSRGGPPVLGIRVGEASTTAARFWVPTQRDVDRLLRHLCGLRREVVTTR